MNKHITLVFALAAGLASAGFLPLKDRLVIPAAVKTIAVYPSDELIGRGDDLTSAFRDRLQYDLRQIPWFDVADRDELNDAIARFHAEDPVPYLLSFHALVSMDRSTNGGIRVKVLFPYAERRDESVFRIRDAAGLDSALASVRELLTKRLPLSGEILEVRSLPGSVKKVIVNIGANYDVHQDALFVAFRSNIRPVGVVRIDSVLGLASEAVVLSEADLLSPGDAVLPATPDVLSHLNSRFVTVDGRESVTVSTAVRIPALKSRFARVFPSDFDDAFVAVDEQSVLFIDPVHRRSVVLCRDVRIDHLIWKPGTHTVAYSAGPDLWIHDADRDIRIRLVMTPSGPTFPSFNRVFNPTNRAEVLDFAWDAHDSRFAFFLRDQGLFLTRDFRTVSQLSVPRLYPGTERLSLAFRPDDEALWIKTPNNFDNLASVFLVELSSGRLLRSWENVPDKPGLTLPSDKDGLIELLIDAYGRTNLCRLDERGDRMIRPNFHEQIVCSDGMSVFLSGPVDGSFGIFRSEVGRESRTPWKLLRQACFMGGSDRLAVSGFMSDTDKDGVIDWRDKSPVITTVPGEWKKGEVLAVDCDEFEGFSATGRIMFYRKGDRLFYRIISNSPKMPPKAK
jgi:hypothetical protein